MAQNVTIIAPDGTAGDVPSGNLNAALAAGGKLGIHVYAPDGTAGFVPHDKLGDALKAGATYSPSAAPNTAPKGFAQSIAATIPQMAQGLYHNFVDAPRDAGEAAVKGTNDQSGIIARALGQFGLGADRTFVAPAVANGRAAIADAQSPNLSNRLASASEAVGAIPIIGSGVDAGKAVLQQYLSGDRGGAAGSLAGNLITAGIGGAIGSKLGAPAVDGTLSPLERSAVSVTKAVNPQGTAFRGYRQAVADQGVNVLDYAKRNNLPITDARDFGKVAQLAADETQNHYNSNVLGPHADTQVPLNGVQSDLGQNASLGQVNERVNNINQDLRAGQRKATPGQTASALSGDDIRALQAEHSGLADILHRSLGDLNQMDPRDVAALRVRGGQMRTLAGETEGAADSLSGTAGKAEVGAGPGLPTSAHGALQEILSKLPGMAPEAIAARNVRSSLRGLRDVADAPRGGLPASFPQNQIAPNAADAINLQAQQALQQQGLQGVLRSQALDQEVRNQVAQRSGLADILRQQQRDIEAEAINNRLLNQGIQSRPRGR